VRGAGPREQVVGPMVVEARRVALCGYLGPAAAERDSPGAGYRHGAIGNVDQRDGRPGDGGPARSMEDVPAMSPARPPMIAARTD
jgi:hypothetical protein